MSRPPPSMPTHSGGYPSYLPPPYMMHGLPVQSNSTGSQESFVTQAPLPYHLPRDHPAYGTQPRFLQGPMMLQQSRSEGSSSSQNSLNPASGAFVPTGFPPTTIASSGGPALQATSMASGMQLAAPLTSSTMSFGSQTTYNTQSLSSGGGTDRFARDSFSSASTQPYEQSGPQYGASSYAPQPPMYPAPPMYPPPGPGPLPNPSGYYPPPTGYQPYPGHPYHPGPPGAQMGPTSPSYPQGMYTNPGEVGPFGNYPPPPPHMPSIGTASYNPYGNIPGQMGNYNAGMAASPTMSYHSTMTFSPTPSALAPYNAGGSQGVSNAWGNIYGNNGGYGGSTHYGAYGHQSLAPPNYTTNFGGGSNGSSGTKQRYNPNQSRGNHGGGANNNNNASYGGGGGKKKSKKDKIKQAEASQGGNVQQAQAQTARTTQGNTQQAGRDKKGKGKRKETDVKLLLPAQVAVQKSVASSPEQRRELPARVQLRRTTSHHSAASLLSMVSQRTAATQKLAISHFAPQETKATIDGGDACTPGPKPHVPFSECASEPRGMGLVTPQLRTVRGMSITSRSDVVVATDPIRNNEKSSVVANWLESTPTNNIQALSLEEAAATIKRYDQRSPPKMPSLFGGSSASGATLSLKPMSDGDPFVSRRPQMGSLGIRAALASQQQGVMSRQLAALTQGGTRKPTIEEALDQNNLPFVEYCRKAKADEFGVIRIKNIPYSVNRPEVLAFLGRNARIVDEKYHEPVHIIMERVTSKTLDCFVEFIDFNEAVSAVQRYEQNRNGGRGGRLGQRHVEVELSSQADLMKELFPKTKNVVWHGSTPKIVSTNPNDRYNSGFQGFVSHEELVMLVKHVEAPQRSPFSKECPQRPFECLISTLIKFPWYMVDYITIQDRFLLYKATFDLLELLVSRIKNGDGQDTHLTAMLLKRVWNAALKCPGFSPVMKDDIVYICGIPEQIAKEHGVAPFATGWNALFTIGNKPDVPQDLLLYYIALIREATEARKPKLSLAEQAASGDGGDRDTKRKLFGDLDVYTNHNKRAILGLTLQQVAHYEWAAIEHCLHMALTPKIEG